MSKEAMKLALEALQYPLNTSHEGFNVDMAELLAHRAIKALEAALAKQEQDEPVAYINIEKRRLEWAHDYMSWDTPTVVNLPRIPLYTTPQPKQEQGEPDVSSKLKFDCEFVDGTVADLTVYGSERDIKRLEARIKFWWNLEQHSGTPDSDKGERIIWGKPPQQRTWVGLTDEEILELFGVKGSADSDINPLRLLADSRRIEAKLKEKNTP